MSDNPATTLLDLVTILKNAIAETEANTPEIAIKKATLELKTQMIREANGNVALIPIKLGGATKTTAIQTLHLEFNLKRQSTAGLKEADMQNLRQSVVQGIQAVKIAVRDAGKSMSNPELPILAFESAEVTLNFVLDQNGQINFFKDAFSASASAQHANTIKLTLAKP